ncbi:DUF6977 family protein [Cytobacillus sp. FJAT-54145]|uniref:DUF6977 family protein n=1 Tax=Cytobacillus spartinae TaxID=3299023 RepID=A0ABW6KA45_9BACI
MTQVLECSSKGDKRFSAFFAWVTIFGVNNSIENHYQLSKRFGTDPAPKHWKECKGKKPTHFVVNGEPFDMELFSLWYKYLWLVFLDKRPDLVAFASQFEDFTDMFRGKSVNCQADVIKQYVKEGRASLLRDIEPLLTAFQEQGFRV